MIIVSDSSPLIFLAKLQKLDLLDKLFSAKIIVPDAVRNEVLSPSIPPKDELYFIRFLETCDVVEIERRDSFHLKALSAVDNSVLCYAIDKHADYLLADDHLVRRVATGNDIKPIGTLGILFRAISHSLLSKEEVKELIEELIQEHHFRISIELYESVIQTINAI